MKIRTIQATTTADYDNLVNDSEAQLNKAGTPVKFTQTHATLVEGKIILTAVLFYNG